MGRGILAVAAALPRARMRVTEIAEQLGLDTTLATDLGIIEKPIARDDDEHPSDFCCRAARDALLSIGASPSDVGLVLSTGVSAEFLPSWSNAIEVIGKLGAQRATGFDVQLGCAAPVAALAMLRDRTVEPGRPPLALVVSAERWTHTLSRRAPFPPALLAHADGGAACVVGDDAALTLGPHAMLVEPAFNSYLVTPAGGTREPVTDATVREGRHFRTSANRKEHGSLVGRYGRCYNSVVQDVLAQLPESRRDIGCLITNQVRATMREVLCSELGVPMERTVSSYARFGHLGGADMFVGLELALRRGTLPAPTTIVAASSLPAFGAMALLHDPQGAALRAGTQSAVAELVTT